MSDRRQIRLLLAIVQGRWGEAEALGGAALADPRGFVALCRECDVAAWVHRELAATARFDLVGADVEAELDRLRARVRRDNLLLFARAEQAVDALLEAGIVPLALKGLDLIHRIYERFDERTLDDFDLLVEPARLPEALAALERAGFVVPEQAKHRHYVRSSHHLPLQSPGPIGVEFELHWNLVQDRRFHVDASALLQRALPLRIDGRELLRLEDHDLVAHLLLHHFTHYFDRRLKWAVDLARVSRAPGFSWPIVAERLETWGATVVGAAALRHLARTVPDWIPQAMLERLPLAAWRRLATWPLRSSHPLELYRATRQRTTQLYLAAALWERPATLPGWLLHRTLRGRRRGPNPLDVG